MYEVIYTIFSFVFDAEIPFRKVFDSMDEATHFGLMKTQEGFNVQINKIKAS